MLVEDVNIYQGNSWIPWVSVTENQVAKDCTDYECSLIIKAVNSYEAAIVVEESIIWTSRSTGIGKFELTPDDTSVMTAAVYFYEIFIHRNDSVEEMRKTIKKGKLIVQASLGLT